IKVARGEGKGPHEVDAISGATRTSTGVTDLLHFWLGPDGYGPYLARLKEEGNR
ncbi:MAG: FMN-binding protein, partial [Akkermansiaceae bacterium]|nr:FMN-binding protein [Akkermansiaceae bacterium]